MYSGDRPSTSGHHSSQQPFYSHPPPNHHTQGPSTSRDGIPPPEDSHPSSPHYIEMMPMRVSNGGEEELEMEGEEFPLEEVMEGMEGEGKDVKREGEGGGGGKMMPSMEKKYKPDSYNMKKMIREFWPMQRARVEKMSVKYLREASRNQVLPLARVKKIMKIDENVQKQMIAADAPLLLSVASEMFIEELTLRSWEVTEEAKRKTLQKMDVATASTRHEHMDFLIDIIPRTGVQPRPKTEMNKGGGGGQAQVVQIVRDGSSMGQLIKGGAILTEGIPSTSNQQEYSARLESGEEAQVIQIGKPIPLSSHALSQMGLGHLPGPVVHLQHQPPHHSSHFVHSQPHPSHSHSSSHPSSSSSHHQTTVRIPSHLVSSPVNRGKSMPRGGKAGPSRPQPHHMSSQPGPSRTN